MGLRKELKEDVWRIIDGNTVPKERKNKFRLLVLQLLLESEGFNLGEAFSFADNLEVRYNKIIDNFDNYINDSNGDLLKLLKHIDKDYDNQIEPLLEKIKKHNKSD